MTALDRTLPRPGAGIRFTERGEGRPVVFLHGAGMDHTAFRAQADAVHGAGLRVVQCDLRGHGASEMGVGVRFSAPDALADLAALLDSLELTDAVLVGHSLGGNLAQAFVREHPERTGGLIIVGSTWNAGPLTAVEQFALGLAAPLLRLIPARSLPRMMAKASAVTPPAIAEIETVFARMPKQTFIDVWRATASLVDPDPQYRTPVPLALIRGAQDRTGNIAKAMSQWAQAEGAVEQVVADAGHVVMWDAPDATSRAILAALSAFS